MLGIRRFAGDMLDSLNEHVRYDEADARRIIRSVTRALAHLHHHHVLHRDIKVRSMAERGAERARLHRAATLD